MREMKDSGIEWIGDAPQNWQLVRIKVCISRRDSGAWGEEAMGEPGDCVCIRVADMDYNRLRLKDDLPFTYRNYEEKVIESLKLADGDILIEKSGGGEKTLVGRAVMFRGTLQAVFANFMERIRCRDFVRSRFLLYILAVLYQSGYIKNYIKQTTGIQNLDISSMFSKEYLALPPVVVQDRITDYLDRKCSQIDAIIARQQEVIEKLKAYKLSVITEAVTKGLNPNVPMKDSGIDFIGSIPETWRICRLRNIGTLQNGISKGGEFFGHGFPFVSYGDVYRNFSLPVRVAGLIDSSDEERRNYSVESGDIFFTRTSETIEEVGFSSVCEETIPDATFAGFLIRVRPFTDNLVPKFAKYYFRSNHHRYYLVKQMNLVTRASLGQDLLKSMPVLVPPKDEQISIAAYLDKKCGAIESSIEYKQRVIERLTAHKKSLIYEVVTGKKEV